MRTTISLDDDVAAAVEQLRRKTGAGVSEAVNELARRGLRSTPGPRVSVPTGRLGVRIDISNVAEALDVAEGSSSA